MTSTGGRTDQFGNFLADRKNYATASTFSVFGRYGQLLHMQRGQPVCLYVGHMAAYCAVQKKLSKCRLEETRLSPRNHVLDGVRIGAEFQECCRRCRIDVRPTVLAFTGLRTPIHLAIGTIRTAAEMQAVATIPAATCLFFITRCFLSAVFRRHVHAGYKHAIKYFVLARSYSGLPALAGPASLLADSFQPRSADVRQLRRGLHLPDHVHRSSYWRTDSDHPAAAAVAAAGRPRRAVRRSHQLPRRIHGGTASRRPTGVRSARWRRAGG